MAKTNDDQPVCCRLVAWKSFAKFVARVERTEGLLGCAVALASHQMRDVSVREVHGSINAWAGDILARVHGTQPQARLAHLHELLFEQLGFCGDTDDYYNPLNSYLPAVVRLRRGLPITLCLIYKAVADRLGFHVRGIGLPGHFIAAVDDGDHALYVDPFHAGRVMSVDDARRLVAELFAGEVEWSDELLRPVSNRHWLSRMLQNLLHVFTEQRQYDNMAAMLELEMLLWPGHAVLRRDLGLILARLGKTAPAARHLRSYIQSNPDDPIREDIRQILGVMTSK